jgi:UDPglucose--hexose-1-phosphate uridylyltransferase
VTVRRTEARMADGRELFYFDDTEPFASDGRVPPPDTRDLPNVQHASTIRYDVLTGEWVTIAAHRQDRTFLPPADHCPLCPTRPGREPTEIPAEAYDVVVFENRFPSFAQDVLTDVPPEVDGNRLWPQRPGVGRSEVVCFTSDHNSSFGALPVSRVGTVIEAWTNRTAELSALPGVEEVFVFENRGTEIGVTLEHPHGQIYAYPFVTPRTGQLLQRATEHHERTGRDLLGDVLEAERKAGTRVVREGEHWTVFVPAAARWPVEAHIVPHRALPDFTALDDEERAELAVLYRDLLQRVEVYFDESGPPPYIAGWHQAPVRARRGLTRMYLQLFSLRRAPGKLKYLAGSESGAGAWISDVMPERIAQRLRELG